MYSIIQLLHVLVAVTLVGLILLQTSKGGLGSAFGGGEVYRTRRGAEKVVFRATVVFALLFLLTSITNLLIRP